MLLWVPTWAAAVRRRWLRWPGSAASREIAALVVLLAGVGVLMAFSVELSPGSAAALGAVLLLAIAVILRRIIRRLAAVFGPVLLYDLVRTARRGQLAAHRCLYAGFLVSIIFLIFWIQYPNLSELIAGLSVSVNEKARFGLVIFTTFMAVQMTMVFLVAPAYCAGAIAQEKERRTLELFLTTELTDREIVLGLLGARLGNLFLLVLTGLPILSLFEFLGGVDPNLVIGAFVATLTTMASVASLSILMSVHARSTLTAIFFTYLWMLFAIPLMIPLVGAVSWSVVQDPAETHSAVFLVIMLGYALLNCMVAWACARGAVVELRNAALGVVPSATSGSKSRLDPSVASRLDPLLKSYWQAQLQPLAADAQDTSAQVGAPAGDGVPRPDGQRLESARPAIAGSSPKTLQRHVPMGEHALLWKERNINRALSSSESRVLVMAFAWAATGVALFAFLMYVLGNLADARSFGEMTQPWIRGLGTVLTCVLLLIVALNGAGRVSREREQRTLDSLLMLPVRWEDILAAKWWASILSVKAGAMALVVIWGLGWLTGGLSLAAVPLLLAATIAYAVCMSSVGLWFSTSCGTTLRANLFTVLTAMLLLVGPGYVLQYVWGGPFYRESATAPPAWGLLLVDYGLTPLATLNTLAFRSDDLLQLNGLLPTTRVLAAVGGLQLYLLLAAGLWLAARSRLRAGKGPAPVAAGSSRRLHRVAMLTSARQPVVSIPIPGAPCP
jgi:ABC-type transport system involved in multi-copper enzyme maturation permease subunit